MDITKILDIFNNLKNNVTLNNFENLFNYFLEYFDKIFENKDKKEIIFLNFQLKLSHYISDIDLIKLLANKLINKSKKIKDYDDDIEKYVEKAEKILEKL